MAKIVYLIIIVLSYMKYSNSINTPINKPSISRCSSSPNLRLLYNTTTSLSSLTTYNDVSNNVICSETYKSVIYNKYKRNLYLRSKEKYTFGDTK